MDFCAQCHTPIEKKILSCNFCSKYFCGIACLMAHSSFHSKTKKFDSLNNLVNTLKKKQSKEETIQYSFITPGIFTDNYKYYPEYDLKNFTKEFTGFIPTELGIGSFGRVYLVTHNLTKKKYALKVINKNKLLQTYGNCKLIQNEVEIHSKLNHKNIIRLYNMEETSNEFNILLEYAEKGNLFSLIQKENGFNESKAYEYFIQIVNAVYFLHQNNIIHRDIKPENILLGDGDLLKLCDFGWAKELTVNNRSTFCGTMEYMAPEIMGSEKYDFGVDVWSLGILLYELIMGHSPFRSKKDRNIVIKIKMHDLVFDKNKNLSNECIDLIKGLLDSNPLTRLRLKDIFEHPFVLNNSKKYIKNNLAGRKESLDDSNENIIKFFNGKNDNFTREFKNLRSKFGFDNKINLKDKVSSKQLFFGEFLSDKKLLSIKDIKESKIKKKESQRLEELINKMSNELEKGKKKVDDLNFKKQKQFSFEDFRDSEILKEDNKKNDSIEELKMEETNDNIIEESSEENNLNDTNNNKLIESLEESNLNINSRYNSNFYDNSSNRIEESEEDTKV